MEKNFWDNIVSLQSWRFTLFLHVIKMLKSLMILFGPIIPFWVMIINTELVFCGRWQFSQKNNHSGPKCLLSDILVISFCFLIFLSCNLLNTHKNKSIMDSIYLSLWYNNYVDFATLLHLFLEMSLKQIPGSIMFHL